MKKFILTTMIALGAMFTVSAQTQPATDEKTAVLKVEKETHDFGSIPQGKPATYEFVVENTGKAPLIITNAAASCGCTTPTWSQEPIKPGKKGYVRATYNAASPGPFTKSVTVTSNATNSTVILYLKGEVKPAEQAQPEQH